jgi:SAM-dependent methyltransferase
VSWATALAIPVRRKLGLFFASVFDQRYGVDTAGVLTRRRLRAVGRQTLTHIDFMGVPLRTFYRAMKHVPAVTDTLTFVEFGCGKGRALLLAAMWPYRRVIGIEHVPELAAVAERNVKAFKGPRLCGELRVIRADPTKFHLPPDPLVLFFFGTFEDAPALRTVLENARNSNRKKPRPIYAVRIADRHGGFSQDIFAASGFRRVYGPALSRFDPGIREHSLVIAVFESAPHGAS